MKAGDDMPYLCAEHRDGNQIRISVRGHHVDVDQPIADGGTDRGPTPVELLVGSLAACVAHYAQSYLHRHQLPEHPVEVTAHWSMASSPARVAEVTLGLTVPAGISEQRLAGLKAVVSRCTVHNTLDTPPAIRLHLATAEEHAA